MVFFGLKGYMYKTSNRPILITLHKTQLKVWIKDLKIRPDTLIEEKPGNSLELIGTGKGF